jgi:phenylpyruvate tautomerase PptA (4-oxalocrotonate tautomerase family)
MGDFMPIVNINSAPPTDSSAIPEMIERIRDAGALALKTPRDNVWVTFTPLQYYLNGEGPASAKRTETPPPIVVVKAQSGRGPSERSAFVEAIAAEVGRGLSVSPEKVWIQFQEMSPRDVWYGGHWSA